MAVLTLSSSSEHHNESFGKSTQFVVFLFCVCIYSEATCKSHFILQFIKFLNYFFKKKKILSLMSQTDVQWGQENPHPRAQRSHWSGGPEGWHFPVPTENQWSILFLACHQENSAGFSRFCHGMPKQNGGKYKIQQNQINFATKMYLLFQLRQCILTRCFFVHK